MVDGEAFEMSFSEAIVLSPMACDVLKSNPMGRTFKLPEHSVDAKTFRHFLAFALSREPIGLTRDAALSFIPACAALGNERLALGLLSSAKTDSEGSTMDFSASTIDICASRLYSYSVEDLRFLSPSTLHELLSSPSLSLESEDALLRLLIDIECDKSEFWGYIELPFLSSAGISLFADGLTVDDLTECVWRKIVVHLKGHCDDGLRGRRFHSAFQSAILTEIPDILKDIGGGGGGGGGGDRQWTLLYRGSRDGFAASNFHGKCDNRRNTLTVILTTKGAIMGGFTPLAWSSPSTGSYQVDNTGKAFVFTLKNALNIPPRKFALSNQSYGISCRQDHGPTFGGGHDIYVANECNGNTSNYTNFGHSYANDTGRDGKQVLTGEYHFTVKEIEVFAIDIAS
jgi:hypothetical protein